MVIGENSESPADMQREIDFKNQLSAARIYHWALSMGAHKGNSDEDQVPLLFSIDQKLSIEVDYLYTSEVLDFLATFDLQAAEAVLTRQETEAAVGSAAACGDGGSCGGCGGSI